MAVSPLSSLKVNLKLLIDTKTKRVLFAEANNEFVDFLFYLLSIPVGTVVKLLGKNSMVGSVGSIYDSLENLSNTYLQPNQCKDYVLNPKVVNLMARKFYRCDGRFRKVRKDNNYNKICKLTGSKPSYTLCSEGNHVTDDPTAVCPQCNSQMNVELTYVNGDGVVRKTVEDGGFVKGVVTYIVMDDLVVEPMALTSGLAILKMLNVTEVGGLEEKGLMLLKDSMQCENVLTSVFMA